MLTQRRYGIKQMTLKPSLIDGRRWYPKNELLLLISSSMTGNIPQQVDWLPASWLPILEHISWIRTAIGGIHIGGSYLDHYLFIYLFQTLEYSGVPIIFQQSAFNFQRDNNDFSVVYDQDINVS